MSKTVKGFIISEEKPAVSALAQQRRELEEQERELQRAIDAENLRIYHAHKAYAEHVARDPFHVTAAGIKNGMPQDQVHAALIKVGDAAGVLGGIDKFTTEFTLPA